MLAGARFTHRLRNTPQTARGCGWILCASALRERLKPPQQLRKAPQTAWGFNYEPRRDALHAPTPPHPSAQADIAFSQPRIHSPRLALGSVQTPRTVIPRERRAAFPVTPHPARDREIYRLLLVACRRAPIPRPQSANADFVIFQRRIHSLPLTAPSARCDFDGPTPPRRP
jgi:hypothetical protein